MSSFIRKVFDIVNENEIVDARKNLTKLNNEIKNYQKKVKKCIESKYANFIPEVMDNEKYIEQGATLIESTNEVIELLTGEGKSQIEKATEDVEEMRQMFEENATGLRICLKLIQIDEKLKELRKYNNLNNFSNALNVCKELKQLIYETGDDRILPNLACYENLKIQYIQESEQLMYNVRQKFEQLVEFKDKTFQNTKAVSIKISKDEAQLYETTVALVNTNYNPRTMCTFLMDNIFEPIFSRPVTLKLQDDDIDVARLQLSYNVEAKGAEKVDYRIVFRNIKKVFTCLSYVNISVSENVCIFNIFAENIKQKFLDLLISDCISYAIPGTIAEMHESKLVDDIRDLNEYLNKCSFVNHQDPDDQKLLTYSERIGILFGKRFEANILNAAIVLMKKDLHDAIIVKNPLLEMSILKDCMVSKSALELTELLEKLYKNSKEMPDEDVSHQMMSSIATILERYVQETTEYHEKMLLNIPQQSAFFHNNCTYLAEWAEVTLSKEENNQLFVNVSQYLLHQGAEQLTSQVYRQRKTIQENLDELEIGTEVVSELGPEPVRIIRQCLRQLEVLKNVWESILPETIYVEQMSKLLHQICSEFVHKICSMEDIPSTVASELEEIIEIIQKKGPALFKVKLFIFS